mmetsp:Transcript_13609/g.20411  ORF Transcript_13609/g.20411 Transcript_13609/m.20411 type:complete len:198 (-) Transcript_13609:328-921(-)
MDEALFVCPITYQIMEDPVQTSNGQTFERAAIQEWLRNHNTCPLTNMEITRELTPNIALRGVIAAYLQSIAPPIGPAPIPTATPAETNLVWQESVMAHCHGRDVRDITLLSGRYNILFRNGNLYPLSYSQIRWRLDGTDKRGMCELRNVSEVSKRCWFFINVTEDSCTLHMQFQCLTWFSSIIKLGQARVDVAIIRC